MFYPPTLLSCWRRYKWDSLRQDWHLISGDAEPLPALYERFVTAAATKHPTACRASVGNKGRSQQNHTHCLIDMLFCRGVQLKTRRYRRRWMCFFKMRAMQDLSVAVCKHTIQKVHRAIRMKSWLDEIYLIIRCGSDMSGKRTLKHTLLYQLLYRKLDKMMFVLHWREPESCIQDHKLIRKLFTEGINPLRSWVIFS